MKKNIIVIIVLIICIFEVLFGVGAYLKYKEKRNRFIACEKFKNSYQYKDVLHNLTIAVKNIKETPYEKERTEEGFKSLILDAEIFNSSYKKLTGAVLSWSVRCSDGRRYLAHKCDSNSLKDFLVKPSETKMKKLHFEIPKDSKIIAFEGYFHIFEEDAERFSVNLNNFLL